LFSQGPLFIGGLAVRVRSLRHDRGTKCTL